jgi:hypothetical protein
MRKQICLYVCMYVCMQANMQKKQGNKIQVVVQKNTQMSNIPKKHVLYVSYFFKIFLFFIMGFSWTWESMCMRVCMYVLQYAQPWCVVLWKAHLLLGCLKRQKTDKNRSILIHNYKIKVTTLKTILKIDQCQKLF